VCIIQLQQTIKDLFEEPSGLDSLVKDDSKVEEKDNRPSKSETATAANTGESMSLNDDMIEQVLVIKTILLVSKKICRDK
jgi:hypothetical protein